MMRVRKDFNRSFQCFFGGGWGALEEFEGEETEEKKEDINGESRKEGQA